MTITAASDHSIKNPLQIEPRPTVTSQALRYLPASYRRRDRTGSSLDVASPAYVKDDLDVTRLNEIHDWLWLAGLPMPARPLNYQRVRSRRIVVCEQTDLHLVWAPGYIFLKPLPGYLLDASFWRDHIMQDEQHLYPLALGFLRSYIALIQYPSDFAIAKDQGLLPAETLNWDLWVEIVTNILRQERPTVNKRYVYGELRLSRLNKISWARGKLRGYHLPYQTYGEAFHANTTAIAGAVVYMVLVLTAMQVGLATRHLSESAAFHDASYVITMLTIFAPLGSIAFLTFLIIAYTCINFLHAILSRRWHSGSRLV